MMRPCVKSLCVFLCGFFILALFTGFADESDKPAFDYDDYQSALTNYVTDQGLVDYAGLKKDAGKLDLFLNMIAALDPAQYQAWPEPERIAFLINAYNAYTLKAIIDHYPIQSSFWGRLRFPANSIRQISGAWDKLQWGLMGKQVTLDGIEHGMLRKEFNEPRIHFAVNCASQGCPVLLNEAYVGRRLDEQLDVQVKRFVARPADFQLDQTNGSVKLSMILNWYASDFLQFADKMKPFSYLDDEQRGMMNFILPYLNEDQQTYLANNQVTVSFLEYDWSLNEQ